MKKNYCIIIFLLLISLFIYLFYRTDKTVIVQIFISIVSFGKYVRLREVIVNALPLSEHIIYSLPEGLWVSCITITSKFLFVKVGRREINLILVPLIFSLGLELFQLLHLTNGRFDFWDIGFSIFFWGISLNVAGLTRTRQNIFHPLTTSRVICMLTYLIVYFAHVWK